MSKRNIIKTKTVTYVDKDTGEVLKEDKKAQIINLNREPNHIKLYFKDICLLYELKKSLRDVLELVLFRMDEDNIISFNSGLKKRISARLGIAVGTFQNRLSMLVAENILFKVKGEFNEYHVNPRIFAKAMWCDVRKMRTKIKTEVTYDRKNNRIIKHSWKQ